MSRNAFFAKLPSAVRAVWPLEDESPANAGLSDGRGAEMPPRIDTPLLFPGERGGHLNLHNWRAEHWTPAVKATGLEGRTPYSLRHTYAAWSIAAGVSLFALARRMGTSVEQIDKT
jgi:integrase